MKSQVRRRRRARRNTRRVEVVAVTPPGQGPLVLKMSSYRNEINLEQYINSDNLPPEKWKNVTEETQGLGPDREVLTTRVLIISQHIDKEDHDQSLDQTQITSPEERKTLLSQVDLRILSRETPAM